MALECKSWATQVGQNLIICSPLGVVVEGSCGFGFGGIVVGTDFGTPAEVALKAPRRGSVLVVVVFNFGLEENILPVDFFQKKKKFLSSKSKIFTETNLSGIPEVSKMGCLCDLLGVGGKDQFPMEYYCQRQRNPLREQKI